jgi:hypothetical protein
MIAEAIVSDDPAKTNCGERGNPDDGRARRFWPELTMINLACIASIVGFFGVTVFEPFPLTNLLVPKKEVRDEAGLKNPEPSRSQNDQNPQIDPVQRSASPTSAKCTLDALDELRSKGLTGYFSSKDDCEAKGEQNAL